MSRLGLQMCADIDITMNAKQEADIALPDNTVGFDKLLMSSSTSPLRIDYLRLKMTWNMQSEPF